jgi:hypothetical protein
MLFWNVEMGNSDVFSLQHSGLNEFLFAPVGTEPNGTSLSLLTVFARLGADPWGEAGRLAKLPKRDAIDSLATTIAEMPRSAWSLPDATTIATRLVALLPSRGTSGASSGDAPARAAKGVRDLQSIWVGIAAAAGVLLLAYAMGFLTPGGSRGSLDDGVSTFTPGTDTLPPPAGGGKVPR